LQNCECHQGRGSDSAGSESTPLLFALKRVIPLLET
ncbi:MAG: hypothetical protein ACI927_001093, partial [Oceanospirillaceae bacterium]